MRCTHTREKLGLTRRSRGAPWPGADFQGASLVAASRHPSPFRQPWPSRHPCESRGPVCIHTARHASPLDSCFRRNDDGRPVCREIPAFLGPQEWQWEQRLPLHLQIPACAGM